MQTKGTFAGRQLSNGYTQYGNHSISVYLFVDLAGNLLCVGCAYLVFLSSLFHQNTFIRSSVTATTTALIKLGLPKDCGCLGILLFKSGIHTFQTLLRRPNKTCLSICTNGLLRRHDFANKSDSQTRCYHKQI